MSKLKFVGDDYSAHTEIYGTVFQVGVPTSIDHLTETQQKTLAGNPVFAVVGDDAEATPPAARILNPEEANPVVAPDGRVVIPAEWASLPFLSLKSLARQIDPTLLNDAPKDACVTAIQAEIDKRAAEAA